MDTENRMRLRASEREALLRLCMVCDIMARDVDALDARLAQVKYGKRDKGMISAAVNRLLDGLMATIPTDQLVSFRRNMDMCAYVVGVRNAGKVNANEEYGMFLPYDTLNTILEGLHDKCMMCSLDTMGQRKCKLRKALDVIPNDIEDVENGCKFFGVV